MSDERVTLGPGASRQWLDAPEHLAMVLARYRAAAALIGGARTVLEFGCGEGIGARILAAGSERELYAGLDVDASALDAARAAGAAHGSGRDRCTIKFEPADVAVGKLKYWGWEAVVCLDVIEHMPRQDGERLIMHASSALNPYGVFVVGTPSARFDHLASDESRRAHAHTYEHDELFALVARYFKVVQSFGLQDVALHTGHPDARHYLLVVGIVPR